MHSLREIWRVASRLAPVLAVCVAHLGVASGALAAGCEQSSKPIVCETQLRLVSGSKTVPLPGGGLQIRAGESLDIVALSRDQRGKRFPDSRMHLGCDLGAGCRNMLSVESLDGYRLRFEGGVAAGSCDVVVWVAGNQNLDARVPFEVNRAGAGAPAAR